VQVGVHQGVHHGGGFLGVVAAQADAHDLRPEQEIDLDLVLQCLGEAVARCGYFVFSRSSAVVITSGLLTMPIWLAFQMAGSTSTVLTLNIGPCGREVSLTRAWALYFAGNTKQATAAVTRPAIRPTLSASGQRRRSAWHPQRPGGGRGVEARRRRGRRERDRQRRRRDQRAPGSLFVGGGGSAASRRQRVEVRVRGWHQRVSERALW